MIEQPMADSVTQIEIDQRVYDLYDEYCHGRIDRREFLRAAALITGGLAMAQALLPRYAEARLPGAAFGRGTVSGGPRGSREPRAQPLH